MLDTGQVTALTREDVGILVLTPGILMGSPDTGGCGDIGAADEHWHYNQIPQVLGLYYSRSTCSCWDKMALKLNILPGHLGLGDVRTISNYDRGDFETLVQRVLFHRDSCLYKS